MLSTCLTILAAVAGLQLASAIPLDVNSTESIRNTTETLAYNLMSYYRNNQTDTTAIDVGTFPLEPWYWWEAGAIWGGMVDYWAYTNDSSYNPTIAQALLAQMGPDDNYMPPAYYGSLGNDDQAFWAFSALAAAEYQFPTPAGNSSTVWLDLAEAVFNTMVPRWDTANCNGGLRWQIFPSNNGYGYKNSISNGGFFQISARLARYTGNQTYVDWCEKIWDWMAGVKFIDANYNVWDGAEIATNCSAVNHVEFSYEPSTLLYGAAMLYNYTNGSQIWGERTSGLLTACENTFFSPYPNSTNIMYEYACEPAGTCDTDQYSFKAYLARWMARATVVAPYIADSVTTLLTRSASAAAESCSGGQNQTICGQKWYVGGYDGNYGIGQDLSALETVQSLLLLRGDNSLSQRVPMTQSDVHIQIESPTSTFSLIPGAGATAGHPKPRASSSATKRSAPANIGHRTGIESFFWLLVALPVFAAVVFGGWLVR